MERFKKHFLAIIILPGSLLVLFYPVLFGGKVMLSSDMVDILTLPYSAGYHTFDIHNHYEADALLQYYPYKALTKSAWERGELTYWNPLILCGYPQSSETMATNYDPFNIILLAGKMPGSYHWQIVLQLLWSGIGMYLFLLVLRRTPLSATLFATAYMLNGMFIGLLLHRWLVGSFCWLPFTLAAIYRFRSENERTKRRLFFAGAAITLACGMMGGNLQTSVFLLIVVTAIGVFWSDEGFVKKITFTGGIIITAFALSLVMWLPTLELFWQVVFNGGSIHSSSIHSSYTLVNRLWTIPLLFSFLMPQLTGAPIPLLKLANAYSIDFSGSIAFIPLLAGLMGIVYYFRTKELRVYVILALAAIIIPIATPLYAFLYHRFFIVFFFASLVLGSRIVDSWRTGTFPWKSLRKWFIISCLIYGFLLLVLLAVNIYVSLHPEAAMEKLKSFALSAVEGTKSGNIFHDWMIYRCEHFFAHYSLLKPEMYIPLLCIGAGLALIYLLKYNDHKKATFAVSGFVCITLLQLISAARWWLPFVDPLQYPAYPKTALTSLLQRDTGGYRISSPSVPPKEQFVLVNNLNIMYGIPDTRGFESLIPRSYATFQEHWKNPDTVNFRLLGLFHTGYMLTDTQTFHDSAVELIMDSVVKVYRIKNPLPRAFVTNRFEKVSSDSEAVRKMEEESFDGSRVLLHADTVASVPPDSIITSARIVVSENNRITMNVQSSERAFLVVTDTYYPGWKCTVNGQETEIVRANYCMRAIQIPKGDSHVEFSYAPESARAGEWASSGSLLILLAICFIKKREHAAAI